MDTVSDAEFENLVNQAIGKIPKPYRDHLQNVAFIVEGQPGPEQRRRLRLAHGQTLFGLYEGTPLPARGGALKLLPDKITLFKKPLEAVSADKAELKRQITHTVWHEVAHYFGLDHDRIYEIERRQHLV